MERKLMILGDSIMKGVMYNSGRGRYTLYDDGWFIRSANESGFDVIKHCRMGATVEFGLSSLSQIEGDSTVLVEFGGNDCNYDWKVIAAAPADEHDPVTPPDAFRSMYRKLIESIKAIGAKPVCLNLVPIDTGSFFSWIAKTADGSRVLEWLGDKNMLYRWHEYYSRTVEETARETGAQLIDLRTALLRERHYTNMICEDGLHPNEKGHELIRRILLPELVK